MDFIFSLAYFILNICVADSKPENLRFRIAINVFLKTRKVAFEQGRKGMLELLTVRSVLALELVEKEAEDKYERVESRRVSAHWQEWGINQFSRDVAASTNRLSGKV